MGILQNTNISDYSATYLRIKNALDRQRTYLNKWRDSLSKQKTELDKERTRLSGLHVFVKNAQECTPGQNSKSHP